MRRTKHALAIVAFTLVSCSTQAVPATTPTAHLATLRVYTTTATLPLLTDLAAKYMEIMPSVTFETETANYQLTLERLTREETPFFFTNHLPVDSLLWAAPLGQDGIAVIVHPSNPVASLTTEQLRSIYQGHVANWADVGGPDRELVVISREDGSGTRAEFEQLVMGTRRTTRSAQIVPSSVAVVASIARQPGGIGYVSMSYLDESVRAVAVDNVMVTAKQVYDNVYPLRSTLYVVGLTAPEGPYLDFIGWAQSPDGQKIVTQKYAPMLRP